MTKICASAETLKEAERYLEAGADEIMVSPAGCAMSALAGWTAEMIRQLPAVSLIMNRLFMQDETEYAEKILASVPAENIKTVYFSDPLMLVLGERYGLKERMVYRPETLAVSTPDALWWKKRGIRGTALSPLLTRDEIIAILKQVAGCEVHVHGRVMMSASQRKLLTSYREDTGTAIDPAGRHLFLREAKREGLMPVYETETGTYVYSDFVQESFTDIPLFRDAGASAFLVETLGSTMDESADAVSGLRQILAGEDAAEVRAAYLEKHGKLPLSEGYYEQKTIR